MSRRYFGTDGVRGRVGAGFLTPDFVLRLGWAAGQVLGGGRGGKVVIGKDTRISGYMFESALEAGFAAAGMDVLLLGPMPTPAIAYLTRTFHATAGVVVSASHNAYPDNGIKFFGGNGEKLADATEAAIEAALDAPLACVAPAAFGRARRIADAAGRYVEFCKRAFPDGRDLGGMKVVVDCAHGAGYQVAPAVLSELGAEVTSIGVRPNGLNINDGCGATAPGALAAEVLRVGADVGVALDGDGDRLMLVDHTGTVVDGDEVLCILALARARAGTLGGGVVGTVMSNLGLEQALARAGIDFVRTAVGDRYVLEALRERGWLLGGETSGHVLILDRTTTGDAMVSALQVLGVMVEQGRPLAELRTTMTRCPQRLVNVPLRDGVDENHPALADAARAARRELGTRGRVLLRRSGTEAVLRVMVEGEDAARVAELAQALAEVAATAH